MIGLTANETGGGVPLYQLKITLKWSRPADTEYKRKIADYFSKIGKQVSWQELGEGFDQHQFRFQILDEGLYANWKDELNKLICA